MEVKEKIENLIKEALKKLDIKSENILLDHPADLNMGDYSTNVSMSLAKSAKKNPKELAEEIASEISKNLPQEISKVEAKNGFINFYLSKEFFGQSLKEILEKGEKFGQNDILSGQKTMVEYTDPNPFKEFHIGHLMSNTIGESISRVIAWNGALVKRACYQGDVGLHVAKAVWGFLQKKDWSVSYAFGAKAYEEDEKAKKEIQEINKKIYAKDKGIFDVYEAGKKLSLGAFENIYQKLGTKFDYYFFESETGEFGKQIVEKNIGQIFEEGDKGAIIFKAEKYDPHLHTRVFINSEGLPTYEAKELGLAKIKYEKYKYDKSVVITGNEINDYFKVLLCALGQVFPKLAQKTLHFSHGMLRLPTGKMSSRTGDVITAENLLDIVKEKVKGDERVAIGAIKYMILRQAVGGDIIFDLEKSVSTEGDSGVYLQYSFARASSILEKAKAEKLSSNEKLPANWQTIELEKLLYRFPEAVFRSGQEFAPHYIVNYLTELARVFNSFYGNNQIIDAEDPSSPYKISLTHAFSIIMKNGLSILGIEAPERM